MTEDFAPVPDLIPYITLREGEADTSAAALTLQPIGEQPALGVPPEPKLTYLDETTADRGHAGVLLSRCTQNLDSRGKPTGTPLWEAVHPVRQRECIVDMLCHVCKADASDTDSGLLFLVTDEDDRARPGWPEGWSTAQPPLCLPHAKTTLDLCPGRVTALRVARPLLGGIVGTLYRSSPASPGGITPVTTHDVAGLVDLHFSHPDTPMLLGMYYRLTLCDVTVIDLLQELADAGLT
jgi:hypothetical protein